MSGRFLLDNEFVFSSVGLACDLDTAREYGGIKNALREKGRLIPEIIIISFNRENARYRYFNQKQFARKNQA